MYTLSFLVEGVISCPCKSSAVTLSVSVSPSVITISVVCVDDCSTGSPDTSPVKTICSSDGVGVSVGVGVWVGVAVSVDVGIGVAVPVGVMIRIGRLVSVGVGSGGGLFSTAIGPSM